MSEINFPKIGEKHKFTPLYDASYIGKEVRGKIKKIPTKAVFLYSKSFVKVLVKNHKLKKYHQFDRVINPDGIYRTPSKNLIIKLAIGSPLTAVVAEELIAIG